MTMMKNNTKIRELKYTKVFTETLKAIKEGKRYIIHEGGSRSTKSISMLQVLFLIAMNNDNVNIVVCMKELTRIKDTIYMDIEDLIEPVLLRNNPNVKWEVSKNRYVFKNGSRIKFVGAKDTERIKGIKSDIMWIDEANSLSRSVFNQITLRNSKCIILSYNPSGDLRWINDIKNRKKDVTFTMNSTYKDNPFLPQEQIDDIEFLQHTDPAEYQIYALGIPAPDRTSVYTKWTEVDSIDKNKFIGYIYGLDLGNTTALVRVWYTLDKKEILLEELIYGRDSNGSSYSTSSLIQKMLQLNVEKNLPLVSDIMPMVTQDILKAGFNLYNATKYNNVIQGINLMKTKKIYVLKNSTNIINENILYKYRDNNGHLSDTPIKENDHIMDAIRYAVIYIDKYIANKPSMPYRFSL